MADKAMYDVIIVMCISPLESKLTVGMLQSASKDAGKCRGESRRRRNRAALSQQLRRQVLSSQVYPSHF